jgi:TonB family protein
MPRHFFRITIALITFFLGTGATLLWVTLRAPGINDLKAPCTGQFIAVPSASTVTMTSNTVTTTTAAQLLFGGVLNGKAISKPQPAYPAVRASIAPSGTVVVAIIVDESGKVMTAHATSGHPLLQQAAVDAAYQARFTPTQVTGEPVRVSGFITYNFVPPTR